MDNLDKIAAESSILEGEQQAAEDAALNTEQDAPAIDPALAWAQLPKMFGGIISMALPELDKVYTDEKCYAWGAAMSAVAEKHGWDAAETMARFGPEIALTVATLPLVVPTVLAIKKAQDKAKKERPIDGDDLVKPQEAASE